jgi:hypothetical protein
MELVGMWKRTLVTFPKMIDKRYHTQFVNHHIESLNLRSQMRVRWEIPLTEVVFFVGLEILVAMKIQVAVFCVVTLCSDVVGNQRFGGNSCLHLQDEG